MWENYRNYTVKVTDLETNEILIDEFSAPDGYTLEDYIEDCDAYEFAGDYVKLLLSGDVEFTSTAV